MAIDVAPWLMGAASPIIVGLIVVGLFLVGREIPKWLLEVVSAVAALIFIFGGTGVLAGGLSGIAVLIALGVSAGSTTANVIFWNASISGGILANVAGWGFLAVEHWMAGREDAASARGSP